MVGLRMVGLRMVVLIRWRWARLRPSHLCDPCAEVEDTDSLALRRWWPCSRADRTSYCSPPTAATVAMAMRSPDRRPSRRRAVKSPIRPRSPASPRPEVRRAVV
jgi:hypothetical protein